MAAPNPPTDVMPAPLTLGLRELGHQLERDLADVLAPTELSCGQALMLFRATEAADRGGAATLGELADHCSCAKSNVTQLVDKLQRARLVQRVRDPDDRRRVVLEVTDNGRDRVSEARQQLADLEARYRNLLTEDEQAQLQSLLGKLITGCGG